MVILNKIIIILLLVITLSSCGSLKDGEGREVTAYGIWCTYSACGIGYWHSKRGPNVEFEGSSRPENVLEVLPNKGMTR